MGIDLVCIAGFFYALSFARPEREKEEGAEPDKFSLMVRSAAQRRVSNHEDTILRDASLRDAPQDEVRVC